MKRMSFFVLIMCVASSFAWAGAFEEQDSEAKDVSQFVRKVLGGDRLERVIREKHPNCTMEWGGRLFPNLENTATYVVYCEVREPAKEPVYYYYECKISHINDNPELMRKYGFI